MDFVMDGLATGRAVRALTKVDEYTHECLAIEVDSCLSRRRVTRVLEWVIQMRGKPGSLRCDNGPIMVGLYVDVVWTSASTTVPFTTSWNGNKAKPGTPTRGGSFQREGPRRKLGSRHRETVTDPTSSKG